MGFNSICEKEAFLYILGYKGTIQRSSTNIEEVMLDKKGRKIPLLEIHPEILTHKTFKSAMLKKDHFTENDFLSKEISEYYKELDSFGPYGDVIQVKLRFVECDPEIDDHIVYTIGFIARRAFNKPGLAADLLPFVCDSDGNVFLVCIKRGKNPGKGETALIGGFIDVEGFKMETAAECAVREGKEEIGIKIVPRPDEQERFLIPNSDNLLCSVYFADIKASGTLNLIGTFFTSNEEKLNSTDLKRVYQTTAYAIFIKVNRKLTEIEIAELFKAGDDAEAVIAIPFSKLYNAKFAFGHHREICNAAVRIIMEENRANSAYL